MAAGIDLFRQSNGYPMIQENPRRYSDRAVLQVANTVDELRQRPGVQRQRHALIGPTAGGATDKTRKPQPISAMASRGFAAISPQRPSATPASSQRRAMSRKKFKTSGDNRS